MNPDYVTFAHRVLERPERPTCECGIRPCDYHSERESFVESLQAEDEDEAYE